MAKKKAVAKKKSATPKKNSAEDRVRKALVAFFQSNPFAKVNPVEVAPNGAVLAIERPWDDRSVALAIPTVKTELDKFIKALNAIHTPPRYAGVWHRDTKDFEILWTAWKPTGNSAEVLGRKFAFRFRGREYKCDFSRSSERTLTLARSYRQVGQSETQYRNLHSYSFYVGATDPHLLALMEPVSFWIRGVEWDEDEVLALVRHLNFYLNYFDASSPVILVWTPPYPRTVTRPTRYPAGKFPSTISGIEGDTNLLHLWEEARTGDPDKRFLYYYRIIEYASAVYLDGSTRAALKKALAIPNALDDLGAVTESVVAAVQRMKMDEFTRYETLLKEVVEPGPLWQELNLNWKAFTEETVFEGGFKVAPLFTVNRAATDFNVQDVGIFARSERDIRNALFHGRDQRTGTTIAATTHNQARLRPWIGPVRLAAAQVVLYKDFL